MRKFKPYDTRKRQFFSDSTAGKMEDSSNQGVAFDLGKNQFESSRPTTSTSLLPLPKPKLNSS